MDSDTIRNLVDEKKKLSILNKSFEYSAAKYALSFEENGNVGL